MPASPHREAVRTRAAGKCEYCHLPDEYAFRKYEVEHVIPRQHRGVTELHNLAYSCFDCNRFKGPNIAGFDPHGNDTQAILLFHPRRQHWSDHFEWHGSRVRGKTAVGRVTVALLMMNQKERLQLRRKLKIAGGRFD